MCPERDSNNEQQSGVSRRDFMKYMGVSAVGMSLTGTAMASNNKPQPPEKILEAAERVKIRLHINGRNHSVLVEPRWTLLYVLRESLGMSGTKEGCGRGECGACTVLINNQTRYACMTLAVEVEDQHITTLEGLMQGENLGPVQTAFLEEDAFQCGYCSPGQIMAVEGLLRQKPDPTLDDIRTGVSGNLCRCGAYKHIFKAAQKAAQIKRS
ncbi:MAG: 2Fe-2S iron-sulfur cluster-binding protein [Desulfuromonadaceae bacterium]|jgi:xanthine dehydrogenase YagT iron-sulfur-binding subunit